MKIYLATSWRNRFYPAVRQRLIEAGHEVYDFRDPAGAFGWSQIDPNWKTWTTEQYKQALKHPLATRGFDRDMAALEAADAVVMLMPCGASAHMELGVGVGMAKPSTVYIPSDLAEPGETLFKEAELMYKAAGVLTTLDAVLFWLSAMEADHD
jgi:hypothetical protein